MSACSVLVELALLAGALQGPAVSYEELAALAERGELARALERAESEPDPARRAEFAVWVLYAGRDYAAALARATAGLGIAPDDLWLVERAAASALALREGARAAELARTLGERAAALPPSPARESWEEAARRHLGAARELQELEQSAAAALVHARWTALIGLAAALLAALWLARPGEAGPRT